MKRALSHGKVLGLIALSFSANCGENAVLGNDRGTGGTAGHAGSAPGGSSGNEASGGGSADGGPDTGAGGSGANGGAGASAGASGTAGTADTGAPPQCRPPPSAAPCGPPDAPCTVAVNEEIAHRGYYPSLVLDGAGTPHVLHNGPLMLGEPTRYAVRSASGWQSENAIFPPTEFDSSLMGGLVLRGNTPNVFVPNQTEGGIKVLERVDGSWRQRDALSSITQFAGRSVATDTNGVVHLGAVGLKTIDFEEHAFANYVRNADRGDWAVEELGERETGTIEIALSARGRPSFTYWTYSPAGFVLRFASPSEPSEEIPASLSPGGLGDDQHLMAISGGCEPDPGVAHVFFGRPHPEGRELVIGTRTARDTWQTVPVVVDPNDDPEEQRCPAGPAVGTECTEKFNSRVPLAVFTSPSPPVPGAPGFSDLRYLYGKDHFEFDRRYRCFNPEQCQWEFLRSRVSGELRLGWLEAGGARDVLIAPVPAKDAVVAVDARGAIHVVAVLDETPEDNGTSLRYLRLERR